MLWTVETLRKLKQVAFCQFTPLTMSNGPSINSSDVPEQKGAGEGAQRSSIVLTASVRVAIGLHFVKRHLGDDLFTRRVFV